MEKDEKFEYWMSKVEHQLLMMCKKTPAEFDYYDYYGDYVNNVRPENCAARVIRRNRKIIVNKYIER